MEPIVPMRVSTKVTPDGRNALAARCDAADVDAHWRPTCALSESATW